MSRTRNAKLNWLTSALLGIVPMLLTLVLLPKIVGLLGEERFGIFRVLSEWVGFSAVFIIGLGGFCTQRIARTLDRGDAAVASELYRLVAFSAFIGVGLFVIIGFLLAAFAPQLMDARALDASELGWTIFWSVSVLLLVPSIPIQGLFDALQNSYRANFIFFAQRVFILMGGWYAASRTTSLAWQLFVVFVGVAISSGTFFVIARRRHPQYLRIEPQSRRPALVSRKDFREFTRSSFPFMKIELAGRMGMSADTLLIAYLMGNSSVTFFYLATRIPSLLTGQIVAIGNSVWAGFLEFHRLGNHVETVKLFLFISKLTLSVAGLAAILVGIFNGPATALWLSDLTIKNYWFHIIVGINIIPISLISLWGWLATALGNEKKFAKISLEASILNICFGIFLTFKFGFLGPALGSLLGYGLFKSVRIYQTIQPLIGFSRSQFLKLISLPISTVVVFLVGGNYFLDYQKFEPSWWSMAAKVIVVTGLYFAFAVFHYSYDEKLRIWRLFTRSV